MIRKSIRKVIRRGRGWVKSKDTESKAKGKDKSQKDTDIEERRLRKRIRFGTWVVLAETHDIRYYK